MNIFSHECKFVSGAVAIDHMPEKGLPEVAFAGRSNVGKSSLLNALVGCRKLARTSNTPGRTREINFFSLADKLMLVDLPGYGYAKVSRSETKKWALFIQEYLEERDKLRRVILLIDSRRGIKEMDEQLMSFLDNIGLSYQIVLTKTDKLKKHEFASLQEETLAIIGKHVSAYPKLINTSSVKKNGIEELQECLLELIVI